MDPYEQRLIDEVVYLHSLWRQGPPRNHNPIPRPKHNNPSIALHQPSNSTPFKTNPTKKNKKKKRKPNTQVTNEKKNSDPPKISDKEWVCEEPAAPNSHTPATGWPEFRVNSGPEKRLPMSAEEQSKLMATQIQQKGLEASRNFFSKNCDSDSEIEDGDDGDGDGGQSDDYHCEEHEFLLKMFIEDGELRSYYEKNYENGEFYCLVCGGIGKKTWKSFKNCFSLVQHSNTISKTMKKRAHRAYGQVICKVLGWDFSRLPTIVSSVGDTLSQSLAKSGNLQVGPNGNCDGNEGSNNQKESSSVGGGELMTLECASKECDGNTDLKESDKRISDVGANTKGLTQFSESLKVDGTGTVQVQTDNLREEMLVQEGPKEDGSCQNKDLLDKAVVEASNLT